MGVYLWDRNTGNLISANYIAGKPNFTQVGSTFYYIENNAVIKETLTLEGTWLKTIYDKEKLWQRDVITG